jgi:hypothetical protein
MAKKAQKKHSSVNRHGDVTPDELQTCIADLEDLSAGIRGALTSLQELQSGAITIDGATKWQRGFALLHQYLNNVQKGIRDTRAAERGRQT